MDKISCIPTLYITWGATTLEEEEGPLHSGPPAVVGGALPEAPLSLHRLSFGQHAKKHKCEPSQALVKSVSRRFDPRARRGCHTNH